MDLYLKEKAFTWNDKFTVYDVNGRERYSVECEMHSWGKKIHLFDLTGAEKIFVSQNVTSILPSYSIRVDGESVADVERASIFKKEYLIKGLDWKAKGEFKSHNYVLTDKDRVVATVSKNPFSLGDAYKISIPSDADDLMVLAVALVIDVCLVEQNEL